MARHGFLVVLPAPPPREDVLDRVERRAEEEPNARPLALQSRRTYLGDSSAPTTMPSRSSALTRGATNKAKLSRKAPCGTPSAGAGAGVTSASMSSCDVLGIAFLQRFCCALLALIS